MKHSRRLKIYSENEHEFLSFLSLTRYITVVMDIQ